MEAVTPLTPTLSPLRGEGEDFQGLSWLRYYERGCEEIN